MSDDGKIHFKDLPRLVKVQSCFLEASRLFPAASSVGRVITETLVVKTDQEDGHGGQIVLEPGTTFFIDLIGLHYNSKYFPDPEEFRPSRWYGAAESDMTTFSLGPRTCIGRKFALTEAMAFLSNLLRDWKLQVKLDPGETKAQWRARVMKLYPSSTNTWHAVLEVEVAAGVFLSYRCPTLEAKLLVRHVVISFRIRSIPMALKAIPVRDDSHSP
ncbi:cytochrome P450 [Mycena galopus ATCC 62051]|nr:cytochrome P450 [Mycena galopus ATCC 62051]